MNKFSEQLLSAFEVAMDEKLSKLQYDKTIQAVVESIENADTGEYKVKYKEGIISAFAQDPKETFKVGDGVYVTVPEGDFGNKKFISHRITNNSLSTGQYKDLAETIIDVSPNFSELGLVYKGYAPGQNYWRLIAGYEDSQTQITNALANLPDPILTYLNAYEYVKIQAEFMTTLDKHHTQGSYGVELRLTNTQGESIPYYLTFSDFTGDPYHLATWTPQSVVIKLPRDTVKGLAGIFFWEKNFDDNVGEPQQPNIFMRNLSISFVEKVDLTQDPYYLAVMSNGGLAFNGDNPITLTGRIINYGQEISPANCIYQWFKRDLGVTVGSDNYDKRVGWGWAPIDGATTNTLTVTAESVAGQQSYNLLVVFNSTIVLTRKITLTKSEIPVVIEQKIKVENNEEKLVLELVKKNSSDTNTYTGDWYYLDTDGTQKSIGEKSVESNDITHHLYYSPMTFYCSVYKQNTYLGEISYIMRNMESSEDVSVVFVGESRFAYDANGYINIYDAELERTLTPQIVFNNGVITSSVVIDWLDFNGNIISKNVDENIITDSMIKSVWVEIVDSSTKILHYKISNIFQDYPSKNNSFKIRISTQDGQVYTFDKEIVCIKTGDPGTNGTKYSSLIKVVTNSNNPYKFVSSTSSTIRKVLLQCDVYRESELLDPEQYSIDWQAFNLAKIVITGHENQIQVYANNNIRRRYVKVTIKIGTETTLYNFFGVDSCTVNDLYEEHLEDLSVLPSYIQYDSNGKYPQVRRRIPEIAFDPSVLQSVTITSNGTLIQVPDEQNNFVVQDEFTPDPDDVQTFIGMIMLTCAKVAGGLVYIYHPVPAYINTYGNEAINGWDGHQLDIDDHGQYVFAPQIGAGVKNSDNTFTGIVMGKDSQQGIIGLYGYNHGTNTFGLMDNGQAYFGTNKGKITIDGTNATIKGGGGGDSSSGMTIDLYGDDSEDLAIKVGNGNFSVNYGGIVTAKGATIDGHLYALDGKIGSASKTSSDGWTITTNRLYSGSGTGHVELNSNTSSDSNYSIWAGADTPNGSREKFSVKRDGTVFMQEATVKGTITATGGAIGNWTINTNSISSSSGTDYSLKSGVDYFTNQGLTTGKVTSTKVQRVYNYQGISSSVASFQFSTAAGSLTYYSNPSNFYIPYIELNSKGAYAILVGASSASKASLYITHSGVIKADNAIITGTITASSGAIGGWIIGEKQLSSGTVHLYSGTEEDYKFGSSYYRIWSGHTTPAKSNFYLTSNGTVRMVNAYSYGNIYAKAGYIGCTYTTNDDGSITSSGGWAISDNKISANNGTTYKIKIDAKYYTDSALTKNEAIVEQDMPIASYSDVSNVRSFQFTSGGTTYYTARTNIATANQPYVALQSNSNYAFWAGNQTAASAPFSITHVGGLKATSANIQGKITASSGAIGGWTITSTEIVNGDVHLFSGTNGSNAKVTLAANKSYYNYDSTGKKPGAVAGTVTQDTTYNTTAPSITYNGNTYYRFSTYCIKDTDLADKGLAYYRIWAGASAGRSADFSVTDKGEIVAKGKITAKSGEIGGWTIDSGKLYSDSGRRGMSSSGIKAKQGNTNLDRFVIWSGGTYNAASGNNEEYININTDSYFAVTTAGKMYCKAAEVSGNITASSGQIGNWYIRDGYLKSSDDNYYLGPTSVQLPGLTLSTSAASFTGSIIATGGSIAGWTIGEKLNEEEEHEYYYLKAGGTELRSNGTISGATVRGSSFEDEDGVSVLKLDKTEDERKLIFSPDPYFSGFEVVYEAAGDSTDATLSLNGKQLFYVNSRLTTVYPGYSGQTWDFGNVKIGGFPYGDGAPNSSTHGYGITGALYFKIS